MKISLLRPWAMGLIVLTGATALSPVANAAPNFKNRQSQSRLEIWPGQRTLIVLPLTVSETFLSADGTTQGGAGSSALASALVPLLSSELSTALTNTDKFSITRPYKFDPLIRRALAEQTLTAEAASAFIEQPGLSNSQTVLGQLGLEQPGMVAQVVLQSLRVGGTSTAPTVQMSVRGDLYQTGGDTPTQPFRTITVTSKPFIGKTPEDRLRAAAEQAFGDIAAAFVEPPVEFDLPLPTAPAKGMMTGVAPGGTTTTPAMGDLPAQTPGGDTSAPAMPMTPPTPMSPAMPMTPNGTNTGNAPVAPQLPGAMPPLGLNVPEGN